MDLRRSFEAKVQAAFAVAVLVVAGLAVVTWKVSRDAVEAALRVAHTHEVLDSLADTKGNTLLVESITRGYIISGAAGPLAERDVAISARETSLRRIKELTADNAPQQERWMRLRQAAEERRAVSERSVLLRATEGFEAARAYSASAPVRETRERMFQVLREMEEEEHRLLEEHRAEQPRARKIAVAAGALAVLVLVALLTATYVLIRRQIGETAAARLRAEDEARARHRAERLIASMADTVPGALVQYRVYPDGRSKYEFLTASVEKLRGFDREAALRDPEVVLGTILDGDRQAFIAALAEGARTLSHVECDYRVRGPGGEIRWMSTTASPRRASDGSVVWSAYWSDVTERRNLARELREAKEAAEAASRAKSTFLATMSHEIRTPMNGVHGMLELLALTDLDAEQRSTLAVVRESGSSLLRIIDDILDFSRIEAGKLELRPETASIADLVEHVRNIYAGNASSKGLLLKHYVDSQISAAVQIDPLRLQQILNNLVSNAIKFTSQGEVEIRADLAGRVDGEDVVKFTVSDTGMGIAAADKERLFKPFSQADDSHRSYGGTGLGLSICQRLAQMMGGSIAMESEAGIGTTMVLTLPLTVAQSQSAVQAPSDATPPAYEAARARRGVPSPGRAVEEGTLVLLADDHPINRMVLLKQVNALGYAAETAENGIEAVNLWSTGRFGAIITDCNMPEMSGYELARHIRECEARNGYARTPIIACTANALGGDAEKCFSAGMDDYLAKPIELGRLAQKLDRWLPLPREGGASAAGPSSSNVEDFPGMAAAPPIDSSALAQISGGDAAVEREFLARFRAFNAEDSMVLMNAAEKSDVRDMQHAAHRIKGAASTIGAMALAAAAERVERASRDNDVKAARSHMPAFVAELERLNAHLETLALPSLLQLRTAEFPLPDWQREHR